MHILTRETPGKTRVKGGRKNPVPTLPRNVSAKKKANQKYPSAILRAETNLPDQTHDLNVTPGGGREHSQFKNGVSSVRITTFNRLHWIRDVPGPNAPNNIRKDDPSD